MDNVDSKNRPLFSQKHQLSLCLYIVKFKYLNMNTYNNIIIIVLKFERTREQVEKGQGCMGCFEL